MSTLLDTDLTVQTETLSCGECGIGFAVPKWWVTSRRKDHATWYCPNGHSRVFLGKSAEEKLREQLEVAERRASLALEQRDAARRSRAATKGLLTRTKNRIMAGFCPCCNKEFKVLAKHMAAAHPEYLSDESETGEQPR